MSPESGPPPEQVGPSFNQSQQEHYQQVAADIRAAAQGAAPANVGPSLEQSLKTARQAAQAAAETGPESNAVFEGLTDEQKAFFVEAVNQAVMAESDLNRRSGHLPEWLKNASKSACIGAIGSIAIGIGENYAHSKGWNLLPADNSVGEAWFLLVNAYYTSRVWANRRVANLKSKTGQ